MKSILQSDPYSCFLCGKTYALERHHVFNGAYRKKSEQYGLTVMLDHNCHNEPPNGVHHNAAKAQKLKRYAQKQAMQHYGLSIDDFRHKFGKNYI